MKFCKTIFTLVLLTLTALSAVAWWSLDFATYPLPVRYLAAGTAPYLESGACRAGHQGEGGGRNVRSGNRRCECAWSPYMNPLLG